VGEGSAKIKILRYAQKKIKLLLRSKIKNKNLHLENECRRPSLRNVAVSDKLELRSVSVETRSNEL
jgi:hypothetical protein